MACEKCWGDAYLRMLQTGRSQAECYADLIAERAGNPCTPEEQAGRCREGAIEMSDESLCGLCGEPMPKGEEMFNYHGYSGPCPKPPLPKEVPPTSDETMRRIVERVARDAIGLAITRQMLILEDSGASPTDEEEAEIVADAINCLTGDDIGCGDEEDANNPDKCAGAFVRNILAGGTQ